MNTTKHIPNIDPYVTTSGGVVILNGPFPMDEAKRVAKLCAKAPDMLAALRIALAYLEEHPYINHAGVKCEPAICARLRNLVED